MLLKGKDIILRIQNYYKSSLPNLMTTTAIFEIYEINALWFKYMFALKLDFQC